jgi:tRNA modification GTPase
MPYHLDETIVAIASPPGGAARGIVRAAGPAVLECLNRCFRPDRGPDLAGVARAAAIGGVFAPYEKIAPFCCDLYWWPNRRSYTGGPMAELHMPGSRPLLDAAVQTLCRSGARPAEPGEFTLRAFLARRIDLTQAEAVLGVVDALDPRQLDAALTQLAGGLSQPLHGLRDDLLDLLAHLEAGFDFADEDLPFITPEQLDRALSAAAGAVGALARQLASRRDASDLIRAVLVGWPNTGKSSLLNALAGRCAALVSGLPGTTRDYLAVEIDLGGVACQLIDTAGIERPDGSLNSAPSPPPGATGILPVRDVAAGNAVRTAAQAASHRQRAHAHVEVLCIDSTRPMVAWEREELARTPLVPRVVALTKSDAARQTDFAGRAVETSSATGQGLDVLQIELRRAAIAAGGPALSAVAATAARSSESIRLAAGSIGRARELARRGGGEELVAAEVRTALAELGKVVGAVYTDDVLDRIFSRFCIGK